MKKFIITGGTGLIGRKLAERLINRGDEVTIFTRGIHSDRKKMAGDAKYIEWDFSKNDWYVEIEGAHSVIHLAGENVMSERWTGRRKKKIIESRVISTSKLVEAIKSAKDKPEAFIIASAAGYYGNTDEPVDEDSHPGTDFLAQVTMAWENESKKIDGTGVRRVNVRTGIVLDKSGGALEKMVVQFKYYLGGPFGNGKQWFPWIHIDDLIDLYIFSIDSNYVNGMLNAVSPGVVRMNHFCKVLGKEMKRPAALKIPGVILKLFLGGRAEVLLGGAQVVPKRTIDTGFHFKYEKLTDALKDLLKR